LVTDTVGGSKTMPKYLLEVSYTLEGVKGVVAKGGTARKVAAQAAAKSAGGKMDVFYFALGKTDVFAIAESSKVGRSRSPATIWLKPASAT